MAVITESQPTEASGSAAQGSNRRSKPNGWGKRAGLLAFLLPAIISLAMVGQGVYRSGQRADVFTEARNDLAAGLAKLPFEARLPSQVPSGARLVRVIMDEPDEKRGPSIYAMDITYTVPGEGPEAGKYIRVWQTNDVYLKKRLVDPTLDQGDAQTVAGQRWFKRDGQNEDRKPGVSYSRRFDDGITMVVSGPDESMVRATIAALVSQG